MHYVAGGEINMTQKNTISAVIIAKNEADRIGICLNALTFCDEVLVIDNTSSDMTAKVAKKYGARVLTVLERNFSVLRNKAKDCAKGQWLLYIDADEVVSEELAQSIQKKVSEKTTDGRTNFRLKRINYFLGKRWPGCEWMIRLIHRDALIGWEGELHESANVLGKTGTLDGELRHDTHRTLSEMVKKTNAWSETEADLRLKAHHPPVSWWRLIRVLFTGFYRSYVKDGGWRVGTYGIIEGLYQGFSMFITYAKLWERQEKEKK